MSSFVSGLFAICLIVACRPAESPLKEQGEELTFLSESGEVSGRLLVETVATDEARARGLMFRETMEEDRGMLFIFSEEREHAFWMKNTLISLDMIFLDTSGAVVGILHKTVPRNTENLTVGVPSRYVVETVGGWAMKHGIQIGNRSQFSYLR